MSVIDSRVINIDALKLEHFEQGDKFASDAVRVGPLRCSAEADDRSSSRRGLP